nr:MAG TPA: hypothetical protein [Caudoviricetes sp.]
MGYSIPLLFQILTYFLQLKNLINRNLNYPQSTK